ncbi:sulfatase [Bythopirellula polymerisocia]|uniref:sulfatase n=1 Tax=Bythopirellula polymerisocia TaxID=2528003 RepID=UPI0011B6E3FE|nr:sulfatase [Bythopirellula polymerisocia]
MARLLRIQSELPSLLYRLALAVLCLNLSQIAAAPAQSLVPPTEPPQHTTIERPNVLLIIVDDLNDWIGEMGGHRQAITPNLDRLLSESVCFSNAHCNAPVCAASRNSMLSGLRPSTTGWYDNTKTIRDTYRQVLGKVPPLPVHFRNNGYFTLAGGKIYHNGVADFARDELWNETKPVYNLPQEFREFGHGYGGDYFYPFPRDGGQIYQHYGKRVRGQSLCWGALDSIDIPRGVMPDEELAGWASEQLQRTFDQPFFFAVGFRRPHVPFTAPNKYFELYREAFLELPEVPNDEMQDIPVYGKAMALGMLPGGDDQNVVDIGPDFRRELVLAYLACVSFVDDQVGKVLSALENSPHADNTLVVFCSDHGQSLGEKRHWRKQCLWEEATRIPLAIRLPDTTSNGRTCPRTVSLIDLYSTLVELCKLPQVKGVEGVSLVPLINNPELPWNQPAVMTWHYKNHSVRSQRWRYTLYRDGGEELYDHSNDSAEHYNLAGDQQYEEIIEEHRRWLPKTEVLPAGMVSWKGDSLEQTIQEWSETGGPPEWLR